MSNWSERVDYFKVVQRCVRCGKQDAYTMCGNQRCFECTEKGKEISKEYNQSHREQINKKTSERYKMLKDQGLCVWCGVKKALSGRIMCESCAIKNRNATKKSLQKKKDMEKNQ